MRATTRQMTAKTARAGVTRLRHLLDPLPSVLSTIVCHYTSGHHVALITHPSLQP